VILELFQSSSSSSYYNSNTGIDTGHKTVYTPAELGEVAREPFLRNFDQVQPRF